MEAIHSFVSQNAILLSGLILIIAYIFIALEKISKVTVALLGASATILLGLVSQHKGHDGINPLYFINFVDFNVVFLLISMMIIVHISARSGVFNWIAIELLKLTKGYPIWVLIALALFTAVASAFLDNVTTVILIMPVTFVIAKELELDAIPFLITEVLASNIGGTSTLIGDPPNIIIGSKAGFSFMTFLNELTGIVSVILICAIAIMAFIFRKQLKTAHENMQRVATLDNSCTITDKALMIRSLIVLGLVILGFVTHDITHIETYLIAMLGASVLLIFEKPEEILPHVEWNTIFFFIGLFTIIGGLEASGGIKLIAQWVLDVTHGSETATAMLILWASGILSGIIDNIPYTATMAPLIYQIQLVEGVHYAHPLWWCLSLGACLGGNMTIIGAAANVIVSETAAKHNCPISFMRFLKYGVIITFMSLVLSSIYIYFRFLIH
ncbi:MAG: ArsB/NhaD family transporter [Candidatus Gastranaerophilales bacterium]|nr:ArsB/NhaD family transporter [Candidatus Gastranaerophilales bacterium]